MIFGKSYLYGKKAGKIYLVHKVYKVHYELYKLNEKSAFSLAITSFTLLILFAK